MVTILSVFLGLVLGVHPVEVAVSGDVTSVEIVLDGRSVARLTGEPWVFACDFGSELTPHDLEAIGRDAEGRVVSRAVRRVNVPQARSQVQLVLEQGAGAARAKMVWRSVDGESPDEWQVTFDGKRLDVRDPKVFDLPIYNDAEPHLLEVALRFGQSVARRELTFGGPASDTITSELTALAFDLPEGKPPAVAEMQGWFSVRGRPLEVVATESGGADIVMVQEATPRLWGTLIKLHRQILNSRDRNPLKTRLSSGMKHEDRLRVILPIGEAAAGVPKFHMSTDFASLDYGATTSGVGRQVISGPRAHGLIATFPYPPEGPLVDEAPRRTADAVAVAAQVASAANRARAVVLIREPGTNDLSEHAPAAVRRYLDRLQVPLTVWSGGRSGDDGGWGDVQDISTPEKFLRASLGLRDSLDRQLVIWVRGRHLPQEVELSAAASRSLAPAIGSTAAPAAGDADPATGFAPWIAEDGAPEADEAAAPPPSEVPEREVATPLDETALAAAETITEAVDVRLIEVDVVVSGVDGGPVAGLERTAFELLEDGQPVEISHFEGPAAVAGSVPSEGVATSDAEADDSPSLVVFIETQSLAPATRERIAQALRTALAGETADGGARFRTMLVTYDRTMRIHTPLTAEATPLDETLSRIESGELGRSSLNEDRTGVVEQIGRVRAELDLSQQRGALGRMARADRDAVVTELMAISQRLSLQVKETLASLRLLISSLGGVPGRKVLLYVGDGIELAPGRELFEEAERTLGITGSDRARLRVEGSLNDNQSHFDALLEEAQANGVTLYTLTPPKGGGADVVERASAGSTGFSGRVAGTRQETVKDAACQLSRETGGLCQAGGTDYDLLLAKTQEDLTSAYTLGFTPAHAPDGGYHELEVRLVDDALAPGAELRHREGFTDAKPEDRVHDRLAAALLFGSEDNPLSVTLEIGDVAPAAGGDLSLVPVELRVPVGRLGVQPLADGGQFGAKARLLLITRDSEGRSSGVQEYPIAFQVDRARLEAEPNLLYAHKIHLTLAPGSHDVAFGLWDEIGQIGSFVARSLGGD